MFGRVAGIVLILIILLLQGAPVNHAPGLPAGMVPNVYQDMLKPDFWINKLNTGFKYRGLLCSENIIGFFIFPLCSAGA